MLFGTHLNRSPCFIETNFRRFSREFLLLPLRINYMLVNTKQTFACFAFVKKKSNGKRFFYSFADGTIISCIAERTAHDWCDFLCLFAMTHRSIVVCEANRHFHHRRNDDVRINKIKCFNSFIQLAIAVMEKLCFILLSYKMWIMWKEMYKKLLIKLNGGMHATHHRFNTLPMQFAPMWDRERWPFIFLRK